MQRLIDIALSLLAIIVLSPILIVLMILLRMTGEGEMFYRQKRIGRFGKPITVLKFATMLKDSPNIGSGTITLRDDPRILPFGRVLRKTKLNELPQLFNVLTGDMSLIGPRPQTERCFDAFDELTQNAIMTVRPGLSGIGSIVFRDEELMLADKQDVLEFYDMTISSYKGVLEQWYVENQSLMTYFLLIFLTLWCVATSKLSFIWRLFPTLPTPPKSLARYLD